MASRQLGDLSPACRELAVAFLAECRTRGIDVLITCTYRSDAEQAHLYAQGRTEPGLIVTHAKPGESPHNVRAAEGWRGPAAEAFDVYPVRAGKIVWSDTDPLWADLGRIGEGVGLEWGGGWPPNKRDLPHFERPHWQT